MDDLKHQALAIFKMVVPALGLSDETACARPFEVCWLEFTKLLLGLELVRDGMEVGRVGVHSRAKGSGIGQIDCDPRCGRSSHKKEENIVFGRRVEVRSRDLSVSRS